MKIKCRRAESVRLSRKTSNLMHNYIRIGLPILLLSFTSVEAQVGREVILDMRGTERGAEFLKDHSECSLKKVLAFLNNPVRHFKEIEEMPQFFEYVHAYEDYLRDRNELDDFVIYKFLQEHFKTIDRNKAEILVFLLLNSDGAYAELLAEHYSRMFESFYEIFIEDLRKREDWKSVICRLGVGDVRAFFSGLQKAKDSTYKSELAEYAKQCLKIH